MLITLDGNDGVGKTTIATMLGAEITSRYGVECVVTREPGGGSLGEHIRDYFKSQLGTMPPEEAQPLIFAARYNHIREVIRPAIDKGAVVICDRWNLSTYAYQTVKRMDLLDDYKKMVAATTNLLRYPNGCLLYDLFGAIIVRGNEESKKARESSDEFRLDNQDTYLSKCYDQELSGISPRKTCIVTNNEGQQAQTVGVIINFIETGLYASALNNMHYRPSPAAKIMRARPLN